MALRVVNDCAGTVDSSGMRLWYTSTPREHEAGILEVGHFVTGYHIIPPNSENFTTTGIMVDECTTGVSFGDDLSLFQLPFTLTFRSFSPTTAFTCLQMHSTLMKLVGP